MRMSGLGLLLLFPLGQAAVGEEVRVAIRGGGFEPAAIVARKGDVLVLKNEDSVERNVFSPSRGMAFDWGNQKPGEERRQKLGAAGVFDIEDVFAVEKSMRLEVLP